MPVYGCVMIPPFNDDGLLPPGIHWASWDELVDRFGNNVRRRLLVTGLRAALESLKRAGCRIVYIDGSFVTDKESPNDFDACWEEAGVNIYALDPVLLMFDSLMTEQKTKYRGELFPASVRADAAGTSYLQWFQRDANTLKPKGIVAIDLGDL